MKHIVIFIALIGFATVAFAQPRPLAVVSPEVHPDRTVTFRMLAPNAQKIDVTGDFFGTKTFDMTKGDGGVWSVTTPPLEPDLYGYNFEVDGLFMPDPCNTATYAAASSFRSMVTVPGERGDFAAKRDIPHGEVHEHWYHSADLNNERRVLVYTPPGYGGGNDVYPLVFLLHGAGADEGSWVAIGRANFIMDNLLAEKKAKPAIIVMPFGQSSNAVYAGRRGARGGGGTGARGPATRGAGGVFESDLIEKDIKTNILPMVEREYRVYKDAAHRAIMGLSMGGGQTLAIGLSNPQLFSYVASFSAAGVNTNLAAPLVANPAKANSDFKLLWIICGQDDGLLGSNQQFEAALTSAGVKHEWTAVPNFAHEWTLWRRNLHDTLPRLFGGPG